MKCSRAIEKLRQRAHMTRDEVLNFLWSWTAFPVGDNALARVTEFLRVKPRNRQRWFARQAAAFDRAMAAARRKTATRGTR